MGVWVWWGCRVAQKGGGGWLLQLFLLGKGVKGSLFGGSLGGRGKIKLRNFLEGYPLSSTQFSVQRFQRFSGSGHGNDAHDQRYLVVSPLAQAAAHRARSQPDRSCRSGGLLAGDHPPARAGPASAVAPAGRAPGSLSRHHAGGSFCLSAGCARPERRSMPRQPCRARRCRLQLLRWARVSRR